MFKVLFELAFVATWLMHLRNRIILLSCLYACLIFYAQDLALNPRVAITRTFEYIVDSFKSALRLAAYYVGDLDRDPTASGPDAVAGIASVMTDSYKSTLDMIGQTIQSNVNHGLMRRDYTLDSIEKTARQMSDKWAKDADQLSPAVGNMIRSATQTGDHLTHVLATVRIVNSKNRFLTMHLTYIITLSGFSSWPCQMNMSISHTMPISRR